MADIMLDEKLKTTHILQVFFHKEILHKLLHTMLFVPRLIFLLKTHTTLALCLYLLLYNVSCKLHDKLRLEVLNRSKCTNVFNTFKVARVVNFKLIFTD